MKTCTKCQETKQLSEFGNWNKGRDGLRPNCRQCRAVERRRYKAAHPEKTREHKRRSRERARVAKNMAKYGTPDAPPAFKGDDIGYKTAHFRVYAARGRAADHSCVDCGYQADEWSYDGGCPRERVEVRVDTRGQGTERAMRYSPDPSTYSARCRACHTSYDRASVEFAA